MSRCAGIAAYKDFLTIWKDADPDIPILKQAKAEYGKLILHPLQNISIHVIQTKFVGRKCFAPSYHGMPSDGSAYETDQELNAAKRPMHDFIVSFCTQDLAVANSEKVQACIKEVTADLNGRKSCSFRRLRGGDWGDPPAEIRSAYRNFGPPPSDTLRDYGSGGVGFRIAMTLK